MNIHNGEGHQFGNFPNYYNFHPTVERISLLPQSLFENLWAELKFPEKLFLLDIGCNEGDLTIEIFNLASEYLKGKCEIFMLGVDLDTELIDKAKEKSKHFYPSIQFESLDIMNSEQDSIEQYLSHFKVESFDFVSCFSITMWIHINHGDEV